MVQTSTIVENHLFRRLYRTGKSFVTPFVVVYYKKTKLPYNRLGITVTKKVGNAVERNRARRVIKEAYRLIEPEIIIGYDIVVVARKRATVAKMQQIREVLLKVLTMDRKHVQ